MEVKGVGFVGRKQAIIKHFGEDAWNKFIERIKDKCPSLGDIVLTSTLIDVKEFLIFEEEVVKEFYGNDKNAYWSNGEGAAVYSLTEGPYKSYLNTRNLKEFAENKIPLIWKMYYSEGDVTVTVEGNTVDIKIHNVPVEHIYFEYAIMGYGKKSIELVGAKIIKTNVIKGYSKGDKEVHYQFITA